MPFAEFVRRAWHALEDVDYSHNWHIDAICAHLEHSVTTRDYRLLINVPPGCMKSLLCSVMFPAWVWGPGQWPSAKFLCASYAADIAIDASTKCRNLVESEWYQSLWPVRLADDDNRKTYYRTTSGGWRMATSIGGRATGYHPDWIIIDDPHNAKQAESEEERRSAIQWYTGTISSRGRSRGVRHIVIKQRLHVDDLSGYLIKTGGFDHICLPMRYEPDRMQNTSIGWCDPRTEPGELLWEDLLDEETVAKLERDMGSLVAAGQLQQRPAPPGGAIFKRPWFRTISAAPRQGSAIRYWDKAGSPGGGDWTAGVLIVEHEGLWYVADVVRGQWSAAERERVIVETARADAALHRRYQIFVEQEPGSGGKESAENTVRRLAGYRAHVDKVTGPKENRWLSYAAQLEAGNVLLVEAEWNRAFVDEHLVAPAGSHDDQIDAAAGAFNNLCKSRQIDLDQWIDMM